MPEIEKQVFPIREAIAEMMPQSLFRYRSCDEKFATIDVNFSSGKKHGEISCFDLAYTKFADIEGIVCLHFLLNDKKELMHGNQLNEIAKIANEENIQFVASILEDKLTDELRD